MSKSTLPKIKEEHFLKAVAELDELTARIKKDTARQKELRTKMADIFHTGEDGTVNLELFGHEIKVVRRIGVSIDKDAEDELATDHPELYDEVMPEKVSRSMNVTAAKKHLDDLEDYVTVKQGLPTITIKPVA